MVDVKVSSIRKTELKQAGKKSEKDKEQSTLKNLAMTTTINDIVDVKVSDMRYNEAKETGRVFENDRDQQTSKEGYSNKSQNNMNRETVAEKETQELETKSFNTIPVESSIINTNLKQTIKDF